MRALVCETAALKNPMWTNNCKSVFSIFILTLNTGHIDLYMFFLKFWFLYSQVWGPCKTTTKHQNKEQTIPPNKKQKQSRKKKHSFQKNESHKHTHPTTKNSNENRNICPNKSIWPTLILAKKKTPTKSIMPTNKHPANKKTHPA